MRQVGGRGPHSEARGKNCTSTEQEDTKQTRPNRHQPGKGGRKELRRRSCTAEAWEVSRDRANKGGAHERPGQEQICIGRKQERVSVSASTNGHGRECDEIGSLLRFSWGECGAPVGFRKLIGVVRSKYLSDGLHGSEGVSVSVKCADSLSFCNCAGLLAL